MRHAHEHLVARQRRARRGVADGVAVAAAEDGEAVGGHRRGDGDGDGDGGVIGDGEVATMVRWWW